MIYWILAINMFFTLKLSIYIYSISLIIILFSIKRENRIEFIISIIITVVICTINPFYANRLVDEVIGDELTGHCYFINDRGCDFYYSDNGRTYKFKIKYRNLDKSLEGKKVEFSSFKKTSYIAANSMAFDEKKYLLSQNYSGQLSPRFYKYKCENEDFIIRKILNKIRVEITDKSSRLTDRGKQLFMALIFGELNKTELYNYSKQLGIIHIFVISGLHFSIIVGGFRKLISKIFKSNYHLIQALTFIFASLFLMINKSGFGSIRAYIMLVVGIMCFYVKRRYDSSKILFLIAGIWIMINPYVMFQAGFQISFIGSLCMVNAQKISKKYGLSNSRVLNSLITTLIVSLSISPFIIYHYGYQILAQIVILPIISPIIVLYMYLSMFYSLNFFRIWDEISIKILNFTADIMIDFLKNSLSLGYYKQSFDYTIVLFLVALIFIYSVLSIKRLYFNKNIIFFVALLIGAISVFARIDFGLSIRSFSLRDGESYLIRIPNYTIVYDVGNDKNIVELLKKEGVSKIDYLVISHYDVDHSGMKEAVLRNFDVVEIIDSLEKRRKIELRDAYLVLDNLRDENISKNDSSIIMALNYADARFVFNGDIEDKGIEFLLNNFESRKFIETEDDNFSHDIYIKIPHHGSYRKNLEYMIEYYKPDFAIISGGRGKSIKKAETLNTLKKRGIKVYDTNKDGEIFLNYINNKWVVKTYGI